MREFAVHTVYKSDDLIFDLEEFRDEDDNQLILAHIDVKRFAPSVLRHMRRGWPIIRASTPANIFAIEPSLNDVKWQKFVEPFGFHYFHTIDRDGDLRRMFVSRQEISSQCL